MADAIGKGVVKVSDVPVNYVIRDGHTLILNTRTAQALEKAGIPRNTWNAVNQTGVAEFEKMLTKQLAYSNLSSSGIDKVVQRIKKGE